jgi:signal transduction histidine kinase
VRPLIVLVVLAVVVLPAARDGWQDPTLTACLTASGLTLLWWRTHPRAVTLAGGGFWLAGALLAEHVWFAETAFVILALLATVAPLGFRTWHAATGIVAYLVGLYFVNGETNPIPLLVFSVPGFLAGTVLRERRAAAEQLAARGRELEEERELYTDLALRHERARIAAELHDIVGHAISVMIIQAAAGQRLVDRDPERTRQTFEAIADSARQGRGDLQRLVDLLGGGDVGSPDLALIDDVVTRATRSGLDVACRFESHPDTVAAPVAHLAFRVVQESITNALRHAPGAPVRVTVGGSSQTLVVRVENAPATPGRGRLPGTGRGLTGLRERIQQLGGRLTAGPAPDGGWAVEVHLPATPQ